jgi:PPK2 family polyphosphate:nucleotide phosphotransferase
LRKTPGQGSLTLPDEGRQVSKSIREQFTAQTLVGVDPGSSAGIKDKDRARALVESLAPFFREQQTRLYANRDQAILVILQGMDACGKDGVVKHDIHLFYPTSVRVTAFKTPTEEEKAHDFLWRFRPHLPTPGNIAVFNRSWYEDVGIAKVHNLVDPAVIEERYGLINNIEQEAAATGITVLKFFLHVSYDEQRRRMLDRLTDPTKRWKFDQADLAERAFWSEYMAAYDIAIRRCSTPSAPWYVIPADHKWYRDWAVSQIIAETLTDLHLEYPVPDLDIDGLIKALESD